MNLRTKITLLLTLCFGASVHATTMRTLSLEQKVRDADRIVVAEVLRQETVEGQIPGRLYTLTTFEVMENLKGELKTKNTFVVRQIGGTKGTWTQEVVGDARFETAERAVLFLRYDSAQDVHFLIALSQGKLSLDQAVQTVSPADSVESGHAHAVLERPNQRLAKRELIERIKALIRIQ